VAVQKIAPNIGLLVAVERSATGATAHELHNLLHQYQLVCYLGDEARARATELKLLRALRKNQYGLMH
jgi:hypothetical protein